MRTSEALTNTITFRMTLAEKERLQKAATILNMHTAHFIRQAVVRMAEDVEKAQGDDQRIQ